MNNNNTDLLGFNFNTFKEEAIAQIKQGQPLTGKGGILTPLLKELLESALEGEMDAHLQETRKVGLLNRRHGKSRKTLKVGTESFELLTPRDRECTFEPELVKKRPTVLNESLDSKILALYSLGMSYEAISEHLSEMYGMEVSSTKISLVTDTR